jgi:hypothetical protein
LFVIPEGNLLLLFLFVILSAAKNPRISSLPLFVLVCHSAAQRRNLLLPFLFVIPQRSGGICFCLRRRLFFAVACFSLSSLYL